MLAIGEQVEIERVVERELWSYNYTFPQVQTVSAHLTLNSVQHYVVRVRPREFRGVHSHTAMIA